LKNLLVVVLLLTIATPASAADRGNGTNWGAVVGAGILGGMIGGATAPAAPQQQIIVVVPQAAAPAPQPPTPPPTYNPAIGSGGALALGSGNPTHDHLLSLPPAEQAKTLAKGIGQGCVGVSAFPMGVTSTGKARGLAYWSVLCKDGRSFAVQIASDAQAVVVDCRVLQANGKECFKRF
jgi:hypothetical protein